MQKRVREDKRFEPVIILRHENYKVLCDADRSLHKGLSPRHAV